MSFARALPLMLPALALQVLAEPTPAAPVGRKVSHLSYRVSPSLREVSNLASFNKAVPISPAQRALLRRNLFAVSPTTAKQLFLIYEENDYKNIPSLVTADSVLHVYHIFFDFTLRKVEADKLSPILKRLTSAMLSASITDYDAATSEEVKAAALKNVAYFGVADRLLGGSMELPNAARALVSKEIGIINAHAGFDLGAIFPYEIDYSTLR